MPLKSGFLLPPFKTVADERHSLRFLGPQLWSKLSKEEGNIGTLVAFRIMILKKDVTSVVEGCVGVNAAYAWVYWTCVVTYVY